MRIIKYEKTADEMFEELGYTKKQTKDYIEYSSAFYDKKITFNYNGKNIVIDDKEFWLDMEELKAIYKKCEELKWI